MIKETWSDSTGSYIRLSGDDKERMCDKILTGNCIEGILPLDIEYVNGSREYVYETSGYKPLSEILEDKPLTKEQWIELLSGIIRTGYELEDYLLDMEHLVITSDTVFIRPEDMKVACIHRAEHKAALAGQLNRLCEQALKYPEYDREQIDFMYRFHASTVGENVTAKQLRDYLAEEGGTDEENKNMDKNEPSQVRRFISGTMEKTRTDRKAKGISHENILSKANEKSETTKSLKNMSRSSYVLPAVIILVGILVPTICLYLGLLSSSVSGSIDVPKAVGAYAFFIVVSIYGASRLCPRRAQTMVWEDEDELSVCLLPQVSGLGAIPVGAFPWQIGRDERQVDAAIDREGVSPIHARIEKESKSIYVTDEESASGTLLNRNRLTPWVKTKLRDGDILSFGATSYVVEITE